MNTQAMSLCIQLARYWCLIWKLKFKYKNRVFLVNEFMRLVVKKNESKDEKWTRQSILGYIIYSPTRTSIIINNRSLFTTHLILPSWYLPKISQASESTSLIRAIRFLQPSLDSHTPTRSLWTPFNPNSSASPLAVEAWFHDGKYKQCSPR